MRYLNPALIIALLFLNGCQSESGLWSGVGPKLTTTQDGRVVLSYMRPEASGHSLVYRVFDAGTWSEPSVVAWGDNWFVNWADFPSVVPLDDKRWAAHWLVRQPAGGYAYDVTVSLSDDGGAHWSKPFLVHDDGTPTEHGFVTLFPDGDQLGVVWLDGRNMVGGHGSDGHGDGGMTLRSARIDADGKISNAAEVDDLTCDCCQTDVALPASGPVVIYRDRTPDEIRDIYVSRRIDGQWASGVPVADDGWNIPGCPVNGPVIDVVGEQLAATWFTAADHNERVQTAWSPDGGASFGNAITVAGEHVSGYVGQVPVSTDAVVVSWMCGDTGTARQVCYRQVRSDGKMSAVETIETRELMARLSVPQVAAVDGQLLLVWTDRADGELKIEHRLVPVPTI